MWFEDISVKLKINNLRIGGIKRDVDLTTLEPIFAASGIKGVLRKSALRVVKSIEKFKGFEKIIAEVFGDENVEGKIQIQIEETSFDKLVRFGIRINRKTNSVEEGKLFSYQLISIKEIKFKIRPTVPLRKEEALLLFMALNFLRFDAIGGFASRGIGIVENLEIDEKFRKFCEVKSIESVSC